jgi:hypothetical protein
MLDLRDDIGPYRVVDFAAQVEGAAQDAWITINKQQLKRRVMAAPAFLTVIGETDQVRRGIDGWHCEGPKEAVRARYAMATLYKSDRKCSSSTFWNTGNPRNLVELLVAPASNDIGGQSGRHPRALWRWLAERHEPVSRELRFGIETPWFRAAPERLMDDMQKFLRDGGDPFAIKEPSRPTDSRTILYLAAEEGGGFVKLGKCVGSKTSPPARRVAMYAAGNPRQLTLARAWTTPAAPPERQLQACLRSACAARHSRQRAEWFELLVEEALEATRPAVKAHGLVAV